MCCRYWAEASPEFSSIADEMYASPLAGKWEQIARIKTSGEIFPSDVAPVIATNRAGERAVFPMRWGYSGKTLLLNARSETAAAKPTFRESWLRHRCIVPASWYFEWEHFGKKRGEKYWIRPKDGDMTWLCGLYRIEDGLPAFTVLTREPGKEIRFIHDRMPLILPGDLVNEWIRPDARPEDLISRAQTEMIFGKADPAPDNERMSTDGSF